MIVATAGHVDHGKTSLVKALTGVDTDRLPEEKKRGLTIDLGIAYLPAASGAAIAFVDVPGHERFIHNMLSGVAGIDFALLVVAADDGPMPQTREHLAILDLLGVSRGAVALSKVDRVSSMRAAEVAAEIHGLLHGTTLDDAPLFQVSSATGHGVAALAEHLKEASAHARRGTARRNFRLCVDRCFTKPGAGLVVTGTVMSGEVRLGESVRALLSGAAARVRSIHTHNRPAGAGHAGERCALNLAGMEGSASIARGEWIAAGEVPPPALKIDVRLRVLRSEAKPLLHWTPLHVHHGASHVTGRVAILEGDRIAPGASALAQLVLQQPLGAAHGDRFIVRDQSALRTLGGGTVIDVFPPSRGRANERRLAYLRAMEHADDAAAIDMLLHQSREGVHLSRFAANRNLTRSAAAAVFRRAARTVPEADGVVGFAAASWDALRSAALAGLEAAHRREPDTLAVPEGRLYDGSGIRVSRESIVALCEELAGEGLIAREAMGVRLASHRPVIAAADMALWAKAKPLLDALRPPSIAEVAVALELDAARAEAALSRLARHGLVVRISKTRFFLPWALGELERLAIDEAREKGAITAAGFRDRSRIGRNLTIEVLEFFDRTRFTRRAGATHVLRRDSRSQ
jgi:selenocysteine-specific elongation factor